MANQTPDGSNVRFGFRIDADSKIPKDRLSSIALGISLVSLFVQLLFILITWVKLPPQLPIFYSRPWGDTMLGPQFAIWILPTITVLFVSLNYSLARFLARDIFLYRVLIVFGAIVALAAFYDSVKIISLLV